MNQIHAMYIELGMLSGIKKQLDEQIAFNENYINDLEETRQAVKATLDARKSAESVWSVSLFD